MSVELRRGAERGHFDFGWLDTYHSFSFADYFDPEHVQFGPLRVLNEDFVAPGQGFPTHPHRDMEIVTYVLSGALAHKDNTGGDGVTRAGEVQRMTAGTGVAHSEFNASKTEPVHLLQVWFLPERPGLKPGYEQMPPGKGDAVKIHQDVVFSFRDLARGGSAQFRIGPKRLGYLHNAMIGAVEVNGMRLEPGDALKIRGAENLTVKALDDARLVFFDMADIPPQAGRR